ncbi:MAG: metallophosphoesterase [Balneolales bacterium]
MRKKKRSNWIITRRDFLKKSGLLVSGIPFSSALMTSKAKDARRKCRFGMVTDPHFANIETKGSRFYSESLEKMQEFVALMNEEKVDFIMELGDLVNGTEDGSTKHLEHIEAVYQEFNGPRYHVLGNHDLDSLSKEQYLSVVENTGIPNDLSFYSFDRHGLHFVVLDGTFTSDNTPYKAGNFHWTDANIPADQLNWLKADLRNTSYPTIVCIHQLLDSNGDDIKEVNINNAPEVRHVLNQHPQVLAVFQGHHHTGQYNQIENIHYYTLKAMVEGSGRQNSSYAIVDVFDDMTLSITGYRKAVTMDEL